MHVYMKSNTSISIEKEILVEARGLGIANLSNFVETKLQDYIILKKNGEEQPPVSPVEFALEEHAKSQIELAKREKEDLNNELRVLIQQNPEQFEKCRKVMFDKLSKGHVVRGSKKYKKILIGCISEKVSPTPPSKK